MVDVEGYLRHTGGKVKLGPEILQRTTQRRQAGPSRGESA